MLTYQELIEKKLNQLNQQHVGTVKGLETAMHSQGIDPGESKRDAHHVNYPNAKFKKSGKPASGITGVDNGKGKLTSSTGGVTIRDAVIKSGRVDKRPAAKAERAKVASENKAKKAKQRDPFTREHSEWWLDMWRLDERAFSPAGQAAREKMRNQNAQNLVNKVNPRTGTPMKALPAGRSSAPKTPTQAATGNKPSPGGSLATTPKSKSGSLVAPKKKPTTYKNVMTGTSPGDRTSKPYRSSSPTKGSENKPGTGPGSGADKFKRDNKDRINMQRRRQVELEKNKQQKTDDAKQKEHDSKAGDRLDKRRGGIGGGIKKALGGDVIGVRAKAGETEKDKEVRKDANSKARAGFAQKKVGQAGNAIKSVPGKALSAGRKALELGRKSVTDGPGSSGPDSVQGSSEIIRGRRS